MLIPVLIKKNAKISYIICMLNIAFNGFCSIITSQIPSFATSERGFSFSDLYPFYTLDVLKWYVYISHIAEMHMGDGYEKNDSINR